MKNHVIGVTLILIAAVLCGTQSEAAAQGEPVRVLASNGVKGALDALSRPAEGAIGTHLVLQFNTTTVHRQTIAAGGTFDVAILTSEVVDALIKEGKLASSSRADIGSSGIGVGVRSGSKRPDIRTVDAIKQTLLDAKAITYAQDGASRPHIEKMLEDLGIADKIKPKAVLVQGSDAAIAAVQSGRADFVITLMSEISPVKGMDLVGPLPAKFQSYVRFAAGVSTNSKNMNAANNLIKFLINDKAAPTFKAKGIQAAK